MRIYVASRASIPERSAMWRDFRDNRGISIISTWIDEAGEGETDNLGELWHRITSEVASADRLVLYVGNGDLPLKGALVEVGMAIGLRIPVVVVCEYGLDAISLKPLGSWANHWQVFFASDVETALTSTTLHHSKRWLLPK